MKANMNNDQHEVLVAGVGLTPVGEHWEKHLRELALEAYQAARDDAAGLQPQAFYVANMLSPALSGQIQLGALLADFAGLRGIEAVTVEAAEASGGMAFRQAYLAVASGQLDVALVLGVEKVTERASAELDAALASASDADYETVHGITPAAQAALLMRRYLHVYAPPSDAFSGFSLTAHANGVSAPHAMFRRAIDSGTYARAPMVSAPVNMFDAAPIGDGAAALLLARRGVLPEPSAHPLVCVAGSAAATSAISLHDRREILHLDAVETAVRDAMARAHLTLDELDFFELHDRFTIYAALTLEAAGFAPAGAGWKLAHENRISLDGAIPISTFGGSKARGDSGGATGVYQLAEATLQLQDRAGENQVSGATRGLVVSLAGSGATAAAHVLTREERV
jgi:acetyl-CoA C-acetyltransferase